MFLRQRPAWQGDGILLKQRNPSLAVAGKSQPMGFIDRWCALCNHCVPLILVFNLPFLPTSLMPETSFASPQLILVTSCSPICLSHSPLSPDSSLASDRKNYLMWKIEESLGPWCVFPHTCMCRMRAREQESKSAGSSHSWGPSMALTQIQVCCHILSASAPVSTRLHGHHETSWGCSHKYYTIPSTPSCFILRQQQRQADYWWKLIWLFFQINISTNK